MIVQVSQKGEWFLDWFFSFGFLWRLRRLAFVQEAAKRPVPAVPHHLVLSLWYQLNSSWSLWYWECLLINNYSILLSATNAMARTNGAAAGRSACKTSQIDCGVLWVWRMGQRSGFAKSVIQGEAHKMLKIYCSSSLAMEDMVRTNTKNLCLQFLSLPWWKSWASYSNTKHTNVGQGKGSVLSLCTHFSMSCFTLVNFQLVTTFKLT